MANRNWGLITSGATFEALATTIVFFEDPKAALFGRRGKDGGQDARSGDGTRVFQAKHHEDGSSAKAMADAKKEAAKVGQYREPGHARHFQWQGVTHWRLVTNAPFNPTDRQKWDDEVVPLFAAQGLTADYWERANLDALLERHPEVDRSFFQNETRALLSLPEIRDRLPHQEPFLQRPELGGFFGRDLEVGSVRDFLASNELFLVIHGAGGMGKTRLLVEAGEIIGSEGIWQVLWANVASMAAAGAWFDAIVPERPTLLLVDEPPDQQLLQLLSEQLGGRVGRAAQWKVVVAVRSPKDPVLRFLFGPRMKPSVREIAITALPGVAAEAMCNDLLTSGELVAWTDGQRQAAARELARRFSRHPVWLTLAVHVLERRGDLSGVPETAHGLADSYLDEVVRSQQQAPAEQVLAILRWVALLGTVNRTDDASINLIGQGSGGGDVTEIRSKLARLVARRALVQRGANSRLVELKPDVLRDEVLLGWLSVNVGYGDNPIVPSEAAKALVATIRDAMLAGKLSALGRSILVSLGRTELILRLGGNEVPLLDDFFGGVKSAIGTMSASHRIALAEVLETVAMFRPVETALLVAAMRSSVAATETVDGLFRTRTLSHDDVVLHLAWPLFHAAMGAQIPEDQSIVLGELCALGEAEAEIAPRLPHGLPNDGKRAASLLERTLAGGPQFWGDFSDASKAHAEQVLTHIARTAPTTGKTALLKALVQPAIAMERQQSWGDDRAFHFQTYSIVPEQPAWKTREAILARVKEILAAGDTPRETRLALWRVFAEAHRSVNQCRSNGPKPLQQKYLSQLLDDLVWARGVLAVRGSDVDELAAARDLWDWHHRYETDEQVKAASEQLEAVYAGNELTSEFEPLLNHDDREKRNRRGAAKAAELARASNSQEIESFIDRALRFTGSEKELGQFAHIAWDLGSHAVTQAVVREFVTNALGEPSASARSILGTVAAASWLAHLRKSDAPTAAHALLVELMKVCGSDEQRLNLVFQIYGGLPRPSDIGDLSREEHDLLRSLGSMFLRHQRGPAFIAAVSVTLHHEWLVLKPIIEGILNNTSSEQVVAAIGSLVDAVYWAVRESDPATAPAGLGPWLVEQLLRLPDIDDLGGNVEWRIEEILRVVGRAPVSWLPGALTTRMTFEETVGSEAVRAVSHRARLSKYVDPIAAGGAADPGVERAVVALIDFVDDHGSVGYHLPKILQDIDPEGLMIPAEVARRVPGVATAEGLRPLARVCAAYAIGSAPWRAIAKPIVARAALLGTEDQRSLFGALADGGIRSWSGTPGEVPLIFLSAVEHARKALDFETDVEFRPFWEWRLAVAEAELREQQERSKEERGE